MASPTKNQTLTTTVKTTGKIIKNRFVTVQGAQATSADGVLGVSMHDADENQALAVEVLGITLIQAGGSISVGATITADAQGCAVAGSGSFIALSAGETGDLIKVLLR